MCQNQPLLVALELLGVAVLVIVMLELRRRESIDDGCRVWAVTFRVMQAAEARWLEEALDRDQLRRPAR